MWTPTFLAKRGQNVDTHFPSHPTLGAGPTEVRLNLLDTNRALCGTTHGSVADCAMAGLSAEPETIEELQDAVARQIKPGTNFRPFAAIDAGTNDEPWEAGIIFIDPAARVVAAESIYSLPSSKDESNTPTVRGRPACGCHIAYPMTGHSLIPLLNTKDIKGWAHTTFVIRLALTRPLRGLQRR